jgi:hypothetical protein
MNPARQVSPRGGSSLLVYSGTVFWPLDPHPAEVLVADIAHHLSNLCRFTGGTRRFYSVAQHCVHVHDALAVHGDDVAAWGLLHDASEAYLGDIARPTKHAVAGFGEAYREAEARLMAVVAQRFGLAPDEPKAVREADNRMLLTEARDLLPRWDDPTLQWPEGKPYEWSIIPWTPDEAKTEFYIRFDLLADAGAVRR